MSVSFAHELVARFLRVRCKHAPCGPVTSKADPHATAHTLASSCNLGSADFRVPTSEAPSVQSTRISLIMDLCTGHRRSFAWDTHGAGQKFV
jgi:hypothetical protein